MYQLLHLLFTKDISSVATLLGEVNPKAREHPFLLFTMQIVQAVQQQHWTRFLRLWALAAEDTNEWLEHEFTMAYDEEERKLAKEKEKEKEKMNQGTLGYSASNNNNNSSPPNSALLSSSSSTDDLPSGIRTGSYGRWWAGRGGTQRIAASNSSAK